MPTYLMSGFYLISYVLLSIWDADWFLKEFGKLGNPEILAGNLLYNLEFLKGNYLSSPKLSPKEV